MPKFHDIYKDLVWHIAEHGHRELNERTGEYIRVGNPTSFTLDLNDGKLPVCGIRKMFPRSAAAEVAWFMQGKQDASFITLYAPLWDKFTEDDGITVEAAYGHRWRKHFGRDQIGYAVAALKANPSDRRIYISAWDPASDGLGQPGKNVPCPIGFTLSITNNRLNSTMLIRSSDTFVGLPYDVMGHALLMRAIQCSLTYELGILEELELGDMHVTLAHPHFYEVHAEMFDKAISSRSSDDTFVMPWATVEGIASKPHKYVEAISDLALDMNHPEYHCRPEVVV
jgi:thymidylate synthase